VRPPTDRNAASVIDVVYAMLAANERAKADNYLRQAVHIGISPCDLIAEATRREPLAD
jgi:hypothetical protein